MQPQPQLQPWLQQQQQQQQQQLPPGCDDGSSGECQMQPQPQSQPWLQQQPPVLPQLQSLQQRQDLVANIRRTRWITPDS
eukprot:NODE_17575_length_936_cov_2.783684.p4 GENE.NODE_17575_length_936_cov_2.783684~~NODE_17575_length_936_cov_2.783684.p4  ORF type:complete len:80 (-),score=34.50 NODE_17575_length_936_cov_2.783684:43-282(-)